MSLVGWWVVAFVILSCCAGWYVCRGLDAAEDADARLRDAAPELLDALRACTEHMEHSTPQGRSAWHQALAAIAKAAA